MKASLSLVSIALQFGAFQFGVFTAVSSGFSVSAVAAENLRGPTPRVLLMPVNLTTWGQKKYKWLYKFLDVSAVSLTSTAMKGVYSKVYIQTGSNSSEKNLLLGLQKLGSQEDHAEVDVFVHLHGGPDGLVFNEGKTLTTDLASDIVSSASASHGSKPYRLWFSTACYGSAHAKALTGAGAFRVATGAIGESSDSAFAYPTALSKWKNLNSVKQMIAAANQPTLIKIQDRIAKWMGFKNANSFKEVSGDGTIRLNSKF